MSRVATRWPTPNSIEQFSFGHGKPGQAVFEARIPAPEQLEMVESQNALLEGAAAEEILAWAVETYYPRFCMATALGPEGCVIISMLAKIEPRVYVFNLDTGYQFRETLELRLRIAQRYGIVVDLQRPDLSVKAYEGFTAARCIKATPTSAVWIGRSACSSAWLVTSMPGPRAFAAIRAPRGQTPQLSSGTKNSALSK